MMFKSVFLFSLLWSTAALGAPTPDLELLKRQTPDNPIDITFDIGNWPNIAEQNCFAMLCLEGGNRVYRRAESPRAIRQNRQRSGATLQPFINSLASRGTNQINSNTVSAEEFPWACTANGGRNAYVFPATTQEQSAQGGALGSAFDRSPTTYNDSFRITFSPASSFGPYCTALHANPPDTSVCGTQPTETLFGTSGINIADYAYQIVTAAAYYTFRHVAGSMSGKVEQLKKREDDYEYDWSVLDSELDAPVS